ncbi:hypothetical protein B0J13DRAFT_646022 [Dactylonectria estremocensis]|uniref:Uncharacterized protein n=1 Tax=Dactylonectria estremocensis TaxID=1079267 RepID=A0A9P9DWS6_9HYPO|nr:hypothetical protein B0J13DRAFT_646022 [Dactylonectria estremocensis]
MSQARDLTGDSHKRFVSVVTLLHPHDGSGKQENLQKKFLDSFALICSTSSKGAETASAVCLEQGGPTGTVLRLASNRGVSQDLIDRLHLVLGDLTTVASRVSPAKEKEHDLLYKIIDLTQNKIQSLLAKIRKCNIQDKVEGAIRGLDEDDCSLDETGGTGFKHWIRNLSILTALEPGTESSLLIPHVKWASQAKWVYSEQIEALFCPNGEELPLWIGCVYKLGRYFAAAKAMLKFATAQRTIFEQIHVETVTAPEQQRFSLSNDRHALMAVLKRLLPKADHQKLMSQLGQTWFRDDPEQRFRDACRLTLTVHAEMQLLTFYDHHTEFTPRLFYMGTSKKACFLCDRYMSHHPLMMSVSASHQKLYPSWMPAPCSESSVRKEHKVRLWELSRHLEQTTARDLETRLGIARRPRTLDSTAGPSLTTTESFTSGRWAAELAIRSQPLSTST